MSYGKSETIFAISAKNRVGQYLRKKFSTSRTKNEIFRDSAERPQNSDLRVPGASPTMGPYFDSASLGQLAKASPRGYFGNFRVFFNYFWELFSSLFPKLFKSSSSLITIILLTIHYPQKKNSLKTLLLLTPLMKA